MNYVLTHKWILTVESREENQYLSLFFFFFNHFQAEPMAHGSSHTRSRIGIAAAGLYHSHSNVVLEPCLQPTPQLTMMLDP